MSFWLQNSRMLLARIGVYHTQFSFAYFLVSTLLGKIFDVGDCDLPVLTSGNWVIKGWVIKWPVNLRTFFLTFFTFFQNPKTWLFTFFGWLTTFSRTLIASHADRMTEIHQSACLQDLNNVLLDIQLFQYVQILSTVSRRYTADLSQHWHLRNSLTFCFALLWVLDIIMNNNNITFNCRNVGK